MMRIIDCIECGYTNESATAICSRKGCPLMDKPSPFTYPFTRKSNVQQKEFGELKKRLGSGGEVSVRKV